MTIYLYINGIGFRDKRSKNIRIAGGVGGAFMCGLPETKPVVHCKPVKLPLAGKFPVLDGILNKVTVQGVVSEETYAGIRPLFRNVLMTEWLIGGPMVGAPAITRKPRVAVKEPAVEAEVLGISDARRPVGSARKRAFANARFR